MGQGGINTVQKPGTGTLSTMFIISIDELDVIKDALTTLSLVERVHRVELVAEEGIVHAAIDKTMCITRQVVLPEVNLR
ncbi:MAG TPA: hypothetical protein VEI57_03855 [Nitrospirota bacterium]|nr:hypothetical protein [Nitrospirota bacterium]